MKIDVTDHSPIKKSMIIEVETEAVAKMTENVLRGYARNAKVPGFRPGKVPLSVVRTRFAEEVKQDVRERVLSRYYYEAAQEKGFKPIGEPVLDEIHDHTGEPFSFKTTFEIVPQFELRAYRDVEVKRGSTAVIDDEVDRALEDVRQSRVQLQTEAGRPSITGDVVVVHVDGKPEEGEPFRQENMMIEVGATDNLPAFNDKLVGVEAGAALEFNVDYPAEYGAKELAGKSVAYALNVQEIKRKVVPELDDDFAKDLGDFADLAALRSRIREDLESRKKQEVDSQVRQALLDKVLLENPIMLPEVLVNEEVRHRLEDLVRRLVQQGADPEKLDLNWKELREKQEEPARKVVHAQLVLDAVAAAEGIEVDRKEVDQRIRRDAAMMGQDPAELLSRLEEHGGLKSLQRQLVREKSLDLLVSIANIQGEE